MIGRDGMIDSSQRGYGKPETVEQPSGESGNGLTAGEDVDPECENGVGAETACSGA
jgi:hypothetical protein